jgi:Ca2+-binding RTX toxin-like protein
MFSPLTTNPPVPLAIADSSIVAYVIFGKTDTIAINLTELSGDLKYTIDHLGDKNANILTGTSGNEIFVAGAGNDTLVGTGGMVVLNAGAGNDTITINASNITASGQTSLDHQTDHLD